MNAWLWQLRQWARRAGTPGLAGLGLLLASWLVQTHLVESMQDTTAARQAELAQLSQVAAEQAIVPAAPLNPLANLPPTGPASQQIGELEKIAQMNELDLPRGQYSVKPLKGTQLQHWQLVLPVETDYPTLHAFLATALERMPSLALDEIKLKRDRIESDALQAELRLSLFVEPAFVEPAP